MSDCVFCTIVAGELPALKLFEDEDCLAFLDIGPLSEGHSLLIPKAHYSTLDRMPGDLVGLMAAHLPRLCEAVVKASGAEGCNVLQNNGPAAQQAVDHVHFHVIPRVSGDALGYRWPTGSYPEGRAEEMRNQIVNCLSPPP